MRLAIATTEISPGSDNFLGRGKASGIRVDHGCVSIEAEEFPVFNPGRSTLYPGVRFIYHEIDGLRVIVSVAH